jgi:hypothetical protein
VGALLLVALLPSVAHAWTPGTHVFLGEAVLRTLHLLPAAVADLLRAFPYDFLYGSIAADTSIAKKYVPVGRHCHSWAVGLEIGAEARDEPLQAFALGYQAHLAADAVAHNYFVPRQLASTASTAAVGHSYWESRVETHLDPRFARRARELILLDHSRSDAHLDRILSPTIFSTPTNRRIFRGMVHVADSESWQRIFGLMTEHSRWELPEDEVSRQLTRAFDYVIDWLRRAQASSRTPSIPPATRRSRRRSACAARHCATAASSRRSTRRCGRFGLPPSTLAYAESLAEPLLAPAAPAR